MAYEDLDEKVLKSISARLFRESRSLFYEAHLMGMESFNAETMDEHLRKLEKAIAGERRAIEMQEKAIELQRQAIMECRLRLARIKGARGW